MQIEYGMSKEELQIVLQELYHVLTDIGYTDTATAICYVESTLMNEKIDLSTRCQISEYLEKNYPEILKIDFSKKESNQNFWFISKNKEEPRLANRFEENGGELEQPLAIARDIKKLYEALSVTKNSSTIDKFLANDNSLRHVVRRAFIAEKFPYSEIQDNTIDNKIIPIDMLRLKLSFFGAIKFDPRSDKWLRISMFQGAPLPNELKKHDDQWVYNSLN